MHKLAWILPFLWVSVAMPQGAMVTARVFDEIGVPFPVLNRAEEEASIHPAKSILNQCELSRMFSIRSRLMRGHSQ